MITKVGDDGFGLYLRKALERQFGVDARWVGTDPTLRTPPKPRRETEVR